MRLRISLPEDRDYAGWLEVVDENGVVVLGPFLAAGRAHDEPALAHGNPRRNPLQPFGDTPLGAYVAGGVIETGPGTARDGETYGPNGVVLLEPVSGAAALADAHGRFRLFIQGGAGDERLRATAGAVRLFDRDQKRLVALLRRVARRVPCEIVTAQTQGETIDLTRAPADFDPPALSDRSQLSTPLAPLRPAAGLAARTPLYATSSPAARPAKRFFVAPERSGSSGGSTDYGSGGAGAAGPGADDGSPVANLGGGVNDTGVGPLPAYGADVAPTPGADLNPPPDQSNVTLAETGADPLLSRSPTIPSNADTPTGWLVAPLEGSPYVPGITNLSNLLAPYVGADSGVYVPSAPGADANPLLASPASYPYFGAPQESLSGNSRDTSGYQAQNGPGFAAPAPPPISDDDYAAAKLGPQNAAWTSGPPSSQWVDATTLWGAQQIGTVTDPNGNKNSALYQVTLNQANIGNVVYNAYLNDMKYPGQAYLVPIGQADPTFDPSDFGSLLPPAAPASSSTRSPGRAAPASPGRNPPPPVGSGPFANALAQRAPPGLKFVGSPTTETFPIPAVELPSFNVAVRASGFPTPSTGFPVPDHILVDPDPFEFGFNATNPNSTGTAGEHALGMLRSTVSQTYEGVNYEYVVGNSRYISATTNIEWAAFDPTFPFQGEKYLINLDAIGSGNTVLSNAEIIESVRGLADTNPDNRALATQSQKYEAFQGIEQEVFPTPSVHRDAVSRLDDARTTLIGETEVPPSAGSIFRSNLATSGAYGAGVGAGVSTVLQIGQMAYGSTFGNQQYSAGDYASATWRTATAGGVSGAAGAGIETAFAQQVSKQFATSILGGVARSAFGSGPAAGAFQVVQMGLSDQSYSPQEYAAKGGAATIEGALSGALSAGLVGAIWGSEVPLLGNAVGFGVGMLAYFLINYDFGDKIEGGIRGAVK
jgi:hypothetical protein